MSLKINLEIQVLGGFQINNHFKCLRIKGALKAAVHSLQFLPANTSPKRECTVGSAHWKEQSQRTAHLPSLMASFIFDETTECDIGEEEEANGGMHCPLKHHYFPNSLFTSTIQIRSLEIQASFLLPKPTLNSKFITAVL